MTPSLSSVASYIREVASRLPGRSRVVCNETHNGRPLSSRTARYYQDYIDVETFKQKQNRQSTVTHNYPKTECSNIEQIHHQLPIPILASTSSNTMGPIRQTHPTKWRWPTFLAILTLFWSLKVLLHGLGAGNAQLKRTSPVTTPSRTNETAKLSPHRH